MSGKLLYSTSGGDQRKQGNHTPQVKTASGPMKMRLETNGRGGKAVTVLFNLPFNENIARDHMRTLQSQLGCGATFKNDTIELRGDVREKVQSYFVALGIKVVRAGG